MTRLLSAALLAAVPLLAVGSGVTQQQPARGADMGPSDPQAILADVAAWAQYYAVSPDWMIATVLCEDPSLDPTAVSLDGDYGPAQWHFSGPGLWFDMPDGRAGLMPWDVSVDEQIRMMALAFSEGDAGAWSCS